MWSCNGRWLWYAKRQLQVEGSNLGLKRSSRGDKLQKQMHPTKGPIRFYWTSITQCKLLMESVPKGPTFERKFKRINELRTERLGKAHTLPTINVQLTDHLVSHSRSRNYEWSIWIWAWNLTNLNVPTPLVSTASADFKLKYMLGNWKLLLKRTVSHVGATNTDRRCVAVPPPDTPVMAGVLSKYAWNSDDARHSRLKNFEKENTGRSFSVRAGLDVPGLLV